MNKNQNFTTSFTVDQSPEVVFAAINDAHEWWTGEPGIIGSPDKLGAEFTYQYKDLHHSNHKVTEFVPNQKIVWHTTASQINFVKDRNEWTGTDIIFEIARKGDKTEVHFTHAGLIPTIACYEDCSSAWETIVTEDLRNLIVKGKGWPKKFMA